MSSLEKLVICGVRSFSPDRREGIAFESPITLIVGQNGSGKTTIIECLKASISGELPPNSKSGQYFVHDPKLNDSAEVRAQIRLIFREYQNRKKVQVVRSFQLSHIKARKSDLRTAGDLKPQFKVLESILQTKDEETGQITSISHKCADINTQVPILFGVSNSIIENVLFCHQEDSNWPLQDMAKVKKKFDELFGSTRYSKALEYIAKLKSEYNKKIREKVLSNENLKQKIDFLKGIINKKNLCLSKRSELDGKIKELKSKLDSRMEAKKEAALTMDKLDKLHNELASELVTLDSHAREIREMEGGLLDSKYRETKDELEIDSILSREKQEIQRLSSELQGLQGKMSHIRSQIEGFKANSSIGEFSRRKDECIRKIAEMKDRQLPEEVQLFLESSLAAISERLVNYESLDWEAVHTSISEMEMNEHELVSLLKGLKEQLGSKMEEKKKMSVSLSSKKDEQTGLQRDLDRVGEMVREKADLCGELDRIKVEIQNENHSRAKFDEYSNGTDYLGCVYNCTYDLGVIHGELNILERVKGCDLFANGGDSFEFDQNTNSFGEMIEQRKIKFQSKKTETASYWRNIGSSAGVHRANSNVSMLELRCKLMQEKIEKFPLDLDDQLSRLKGSLSQVELELLIIDENIQRIEFEAQELTSQIQTTSLEIKNLDYEFRRKKEHLANSIQELKRDLDFLFANRKNFDVSDQETSNKDLIHSLFIVQEEEKAVKNEIAKSNKNIEELNGVTKLINKHKHQESSKKKAYAIIDEAFTLLGISKSESPTESNLNDDKRSIQEQCLKKKKELDLLQTEIENIKCELSKLNGEYEANEDWLNKFISDSKGHDSIEELSEEYRNGVFEQRAMSLCAQDTEIYQKSLQKALMKFHVDKMTEINRTIKELWNVTYKGHDIDYIAIRSDAEDSDESLATDRDQKSSRMPSGTKSFNYRVVMIQNGIELDMKGKCRTDVRFADNHRFAGRCSAGQRVLACIIIRLALAESFCVNCGILALDEPTTNLDRLNIEGLAEALSYLIKFRKQQNNFQVSWRY